ncbi:MAG: histidine phosphatase family protein [Deltaproteobacteria bacterium]|nr:histidine phosphatase family protein [Deltaproteobacteria bacterium]
MMEDKTRLYLARHGETTLSSEFRYVGHMDVDITENGVVQMYKLRDRLKNECLNALYSSDLIRTKKGAEIIASCHDIKPIACEEFREINLGIWEGLTREEIIEKYPDEYRGRLDDLAHAGVKEGESFKDLQKRVMKKLTPVLNELKGKNILLVAHGGVNRVILCDVLKLDLQLLPRIDQTFGCLNIIDYYEDGPVVKLVNG